MIPFTKKNKKFKLNFKLNQLIDFIVEAKRNTFASDAERKKSSRWKFKEYYFSKDNFIYKDRFWGNILDIGQEVVWYKNKPVWGMNYRGGMILKYQDIRRKTFAFLKHALKHVNYDHPFRGPSFLKKENFQYHNKSKGDIIEFSGDEFILFKNKKVYFRKYLGGLIINIK